MGSTGNRLLDLFFEVLPQQADARFTKFFNPLKDSLPSVCLESCRPVNNFRSQTAGEISEHVEIVGSHLTGHFNSRQEAQIFRKFPIRKICAKGVMIMEVSPESPVRGQVLAGDVIVAVNGIDTQSLELQELVDLTGVRVSGAFMAAIWGLLFGGTPRFLRRRRLRRGWWVANGGYSAV